MKNSRRKKSSRKSASFPSRKWFTNLFHKRSFWIVLAVFIIFSVFTHWLAVIYVPPFPPRWIGIKYYLYTPNKEVSSADLSKVPISLHAVQSAIVVLNPNTPAANELLPHEIVINTFTLTDQAVIDVILNNTLAQYLSGIEPSKQEVAREILNNPKTSVIIDKIFLAVTQSDNISQSDSLINERLQKKGEEIKPEVFEAMQKKIILAPFINPLSKAEAAKISEPFLTVEKSAVYRIYKDANASRKMPVSYYRDNYSDFVLVNNKLIPTRGDISPLVILKPGKYYLGPGIVAAPTIYYLALQTVEGLPYNTKSVGHGWASVSRKEEGIMYPLMTMSLFNSIDMDNKQNIDKAEMSNIATYTNLWINHPDDWQRAIKSLNKIPLPDGPSRSRLYELSPEQVRGILFFREWYLPQYSTQEYYMTYLTESLLKSRDVRISLGLTLEILHLKLQNIMNITFWGGIQAWMNNTTLDTRYNGITSNCVAYSTDFWNKIVPKIFYNPRILNLVPVPGKLYKEMKPDEVIDLPDAATLPENQRNKPYKK